MVRQNGPALAKGVELRRASVNLCRRPRGYRIQPGGRRLRSGSRPSRVDSGATRFSKRIAIFEAHSRASGVKLPPRKFAAPIGERQSQDAALRFAAESELSVFCWFCALRASGPRRAWTPRGIYTRRDTSRGWQWQLCPAAMLAQGPRSEHDGVTAHHSGRYGHRRTTAGHLSDDAADPDHRPGHPGDYDFHDRHQCDRRSRPHQTSRTRCPLPSRVTPPPPSISHPPPSAP